MYMEMKKKEEPNLEGINHVTKLRKKLSYR